MNTKEAEEILENIQVKVRAQIHRIKELETVLSALVDLKDYKDKFGKTPKYVEGQALAWDRARKLLRK